MKDSLLLDEVKLAEEIEKHNRLYWENNTPLISDEEYDSLIQQLEEVNPEHSLLLAVGSPQVASIGKIKLDDPMISLEKTYFFKDAPKGKKSLMKWADECKRTDEESFYIQPKYDGISANYTNDILATRGQGTEDENVTDKVPLIELETKDYKGPLDRPVRGEVVIRNDDFKSIYSKIKKKDGNAYKNSRNAVGGIMGLKDIREISLQGAKLTLVDYKFITFTVKFKDLVNKWAQTLEEIESLPYPMDGVVIKIADKKYRDSLGYTAHHPRGQIAFKFSGVRKKTKLTDVEWSFGKNCLTPVGKIEPVDIGGVTISNVTLHNVAMVETQDWRIGDILTVERAGDVIPHIVDSEPGENRTSFIVTNCPSCNTVLKKDSKELRCINPHCPETNLQRMLAAVKNIGIEELGEPNIRKMMNVLKVEKLKDIFELKLDDIFKLEGFKEKSASNLYKNIQVARNTTDYQLIAALNIEGIGQVTAGKILRDYTISELKGMDKVQLAFIPEIGTETSEKLYNALREQADTLDELLSTLNIQESKLSNTPNELICLDFVTSKLSKPVKFYVNLLKKHNYNRIKPVQMGTDLLLPSRLKALVTTKDKESKGRVIIEARRIGSEIFSPDEWIDSLPEAGEENIIEEKTICFTGKMPEKRSYYENIASQNGHTPVDKVTKDLQTLVVADIGISSTKMLKAQKQGTNIVQLDQWLEKVSRVEYAKEVESDEGLLPGF